MRPYVLAIIVGLLLGAAAVPTSDLTDGMSMFGGLLLAALGGYFLTREPNRSAGLGVALAAFVAGYVLALVAVVLIFGIV